MVEIDEREASQRYRQISVGQVRSGEMERQRTMDLAATRAVWACS
jgi:hypothetical protein